MVHSRRGRSWAAVVVATILLTGCDSPAASPAAAPAQTPPRPTPYPLARILRDDNFADERASSKYDVRPDGTFEIEHVMSNGGAEATVTECSGQIAATDAAAWIERFRPSATLAVAPRGPSREEAFQRHIQYRYSLGYASNPGSITYAEPERWGREVESLLEKLARSARCRTFTRSAG